MQLRNICGRISNDEGICHVLECHKPWREGGINPRQDTIYRFHEVAIRFGILRACLGMCVLVNAGVKEAMVFRQRARKRRRIVEAEKSTEGAPSRFGDDDRVARACFNFDKLATVKELLALRQILMDKAVSIEMVAAERVFDSALSERLAGQARSLRKVARELEPLRRAAAKAKPPKEI
jgi:hypothetical protein